MFCRKSNSSAKQDFEETLETLFEKECEQPEQTTTNEDEANESVESTVQKEDKPLTSSSKKPNIIFSFYFSHLNSSELVETSLPDNKPENLHIISGSSAQLDLDRQIEEVFFSLIFLAIY